MTRLLPLSLIALLAACGADGPPVKPGADGATATPGVTPGVTMSGTAKIGVIGGN